VSKFDVVILSRPPRTTSARIAYLGLSIPFLIAGFAILPERGDLLGAQHLFQTFWAAMFLAWGLRIFYLLVRGVFS
jgi:hypothetical protein